MFLYFFLLLSKTLDNEGIHGGNVYLRHCESIKYAQKLISHHANLRGTENIIPDFVNCDFDGSYGVNKIDGNQ